MDMSFFLGVLLAFAVVVILLKTARVVPQREQFVIERLGKYAKTLDAGFHILVPFVDVVAYKHTLKEQTVDVPSQSCITKDNISVEIDGVIYLQVNDARAASYGIQDYMFATSQLAQTTLRSEIGKIELDRTFEERETINSQVVHAVDRAAEPWGVKILRYEIKDIVPPASVKDALEKQMRAERTRRAQIIDAEGTKTAAILEAEGRKGADINQAEGEKQARILKAEGEAQARLAVAEAEAEAIRRIAAAVETSSADPTQYLIAVKYIEMMDQVLREGGTGSKTVFMPYEASGLMSSVGGIKELMNAAKD